MLAALTSIRTFLLHCKHYKGQQKYIFLNKFIQARSPASDLVLYFTCQPIKPKTCNLLWLIEYKNEVIDSGQTTLCDKACQSVIYHIKAIHIGAERANRMNLGIDSLTVFYEHQHLKRFLARMWTPCATRSHFEAINRDTNRFREIKFIHDPKLVKAKLARHYSIV